ncbi:MAG: hypothetical protein AAFP09_19215 [Cyanobacteria bacterium J06607_10]
MVQRVKTVVKYLKSPYFYAWIGATIGSAVLMNVVNLFFFVCQ